MRQSSASFWSCEALSCTNSNAFSKVGLPGLGFPSAIRSPGQLGAVLTWPTVCYLNTRSSPAAGHLPPRLCCSAAEFTGPEVLSAVLSHVLVVSHSSHTVPLLPVASWLALGWALAVPGPLGVCEQFSPPQSFLRRAT